VMQTDTLIELNAIKHYLHDEFAIEHCVIECY